MNTTFRQFFLVIVVQLLSVTLAHAQKSVLLVAGERPPYIGATLPANGYAFELAQEAFKRKGYQVQLKFVPWARAKLLTDRGEADGMLPVDNEDKHNANQALVFSNPFPGGVIGLLKKKSLQLNHANKETGTPSDKLRSLKSLRFGALRGGVTTPEFEDASYLKKDFTNTDISNLDKLSMNRIELMLVDKYTAADLMVGQRPNLIGQLEFMNPPLATSNFYLAFSKISPKSSELLKAFNDGLDEITNDGTLEKIMASHGIFFQKKPKIDKIQLTIGTVNNKDMEVMQTLSKEFEKLYPRISLNWRVSDENTLRLRLLSDLAISDGQFDVMTIGTYEAPIWAKQAWIAPINGLPKNYDVDDLLPNVRKALSHNGELYALPFYAEGIMTYYRKDLFANAGISMPVSPTYQEILSFAAKLHDTSNGIYGICLRGKPGWGENMGFINSMARSFGGSWFDESWHPALNTAAWEKALGFYLELLSKYGPPHADLNGFNENLALFSEGHCAIWIDASVAAGLLFDKQRSKFSEQLGFVDAPSGPVGKSSWLWSWALAIPNSSKNKKEAMQFIAWATSKEYLKNVAKYRGWVAVPPGTRKSTYKNPDYLKAAPFAQFVFDAIEAVNIPPIGLKPRTDNGIQYVEIPEYAGLGNQVGLEIAKALRQEQSAKAALAKSQTLIDEQMRRSAYYK
jgi:sorbitol/mannitol transport system substrate-binding protein